MIKEQARVVDDRVGVGGVADLCPPICALDVAPGGFAVRVLKQFDENGHEALPDDGPEVVLPHADLPFLRGRRCLAIRGLVTERDRVVLVGSCDC